VIGASSNLKFFPTPRVLTAVDAFHRIPYVLSVFFGVSHLRIEDFDFSCLSRRLRLQWNLGQLFACFGGAWFICGAQ
jgi:hypothetical protein